MTVRAKFVVNTITRMMGTKWSGSESTPQEQWSIKLYPVTSETEEDRRFWLATPSGSIELNTVNPDAAQDFVDSLGRKVYVDFSPAPD